MVGLIVDGKHRKILRIYFLSQNDIIGWCSAAVMYPYCWFIHKLVQATVGFLSCLLFLGIKDQTKLLF